MDGDERSSLRTRKIAPMTRSVWDKLDRCVVRLACAYPYDLLDIRDKNFAIADLSRTRRSYYRIDDAVHHFFIGHYFNLYLGQKIHHILRSPIKFRMSFLPAETLDFGNSQPAYSYLVQGFAHFVELERFDDGFDLFHVCSFKSGVLCQLATKETLNKSPLARWRLCGMGYAKDGTEPLTQEDATPQRELQARFYQ